MSDQVKPARLRVLELPSLVEGDEVRTPYLLILDRCDPEVAVNVAGVDHAAITASTGARGLMVFDFEVDFE